jgi:hypothetical protein
MGDEKSGFRMKMPSALFGGGCVRIRISEDTDFGWEGEREAYSCYCDSLVVIS